MDLRLSIDQITPDTPDWTCKIQIVDLSQERQSQEKKIRFQNPILEDEEEQQIWAVIYGDDIGYYATQLTLFNTYLISTARVNVSSATYGRPIHKFHWVIDKETIVEHVKPTAELDIALLPPTKLNTIAFDQLRHMTPAPGIEIDFIGVVLHCGPSKYAGRTQTRCREVTVTDDHQNQFVLTLWDDFDEIEGTDLEAKLRKYDDLPVILDRNIGISPYQGPKQTDTCFQAVHCPALQGHLRLLSCLLMPIQLSPLQKLLHKLLLASSTLRQKCQYQMTFKSFVCWSVQAASRKTYQRYKGF